jgi:hypothetical protein
MKTKNTKGILRILLIYFLAFAVVGLLNGCGEDRNSPFQIDRTLNWFGNHTEDGTTTTNFAFLVDSQSGDSINGIIAWNGLGPAVYTDYSGTISGMEITLSWTQDGTSVTLRGTITDDGTKMTGTWTSSDGRSGVWEAIGSHAVAV